MAKKDKPKEKLALDHLVEKARSIGENVSIEEIKRFNSHLLIISVVAIVAIFGIITIFASMNNNAGMGYRIIEYQSIEPVNEACTPSNPENRIKDSCPPGYVCNKNTGKCWEIPDPEKAVPSAN